MFHFVALGSAETPETLDNAPAASQPSNPVADAFSSLAAYGVDTAFKYGLDTSFGAVQTICAVIGVLGVSAAAARRTFYPSRIPVAPLYNLLRKEGGRLAWPHLRITFATSPYSKLTRDHAVILQGRPQEGKTTLLRTSIPWYRRWNVWPVSNFLLWRGIYFNGAQAGGTTFDRWLVQQMLGTVPQGGSELKGALIEFRQKQWFRLFMEKMRSPVLLPRPVYIIVDQFEQLMKFHPSHAMSWADSVVQEHTRNHLARVIFVVNSEAGAQSLLRLSWFGQRFDRVILNPSSSTDLWKLSLIDRELFDKCENNVGLYKIVNQQLKDGTLKADQVEFFVKAKLLLWHATFCLVYPQSLHQSWLRVLLDGGPDSFKAMLAKGVAEKLYTAYRTPEQNYRSQRPILDAVVNSLALMDISNLLATSQSQWEKILSNEAVLQHGLSRVEAKMVAYHIKSVMASPVPEKASKLIWRM